MPTELDRGTGISVKLKVVITESVTVSETLSSLPREVINPNLNAKITTPKATATITTPKSISDITTPKATPFSKQSQ